MRIAAVLFDARNTLLFRTEPRPPGAGGRCRGRAAAFTARGLEAQAGGAALALERSDTTDHDRGLRPLPRKPLSFWPECRARRLGIVRDTLLRLHHERHLWSAMHPRNAGCARTHETGRPSGLGVVSSHATRLG
mgnify:CR=1 FL=1